MSLVPILFSLPRTLLWTEYCVSPNFYAEAVTSNVTVFGDKQYVCCWLRGQSWYSVMAALADEDKAFPSDLTSLTSSGHSGLNENVLTICYLTQPIQSLP